MYYNNYGYNNAGDRQFWFPFLLGGLGGAAVVSAARPRPVYAVNSAPYQLLHIKFMVNIHLLVIIIMEVITTIRHIIDKYRLILFLVLE